MTPRRVFAAGAVVAIIAVSVIGWGVPNLAGPMLLDVQLVAQPTSGGGAATDRTIILGGTAATPAANLQLAVRVTNRYPLPVTVGATSLPLRVELRSMHTDGSSTLVWAIEGSAAVLEAGDDSPDGPSTAHAYLVVPGSTDFAIGQDGGVRLLDAAGNPLAAGRYDLRAFAFGVGGGLLPMVILD